MIIETIGYGESREVLMDNGMHEWKKPSIGATLEPRDNPLECLHTLSNTIGEFFKNIESVTTEKWYSINGKKRSMLTDKFSDTMVLEMEACNELTKDPDKGLLSFELAIKTTEQQAVYDKMYLQLSNNKN